MANQEELDAIKQSVLESYEKDFQVWCASCVCYVSDVSDGRY